MSSLHAFLAIIGLSLTATSALADRALVIGPNEGERRGLFSGSSNVDTAAALREAGFDVITADASSVQAMRAALAQFMDGLEAEPRAVVHLSGRFVTGGGQSWLMQSGEVGTPNLATIGDVALSLETVLVVAGRVPGASVVALGASGGSAEIGDGLKSGAVLGAIPQGVTVVYGQAADASRFVAADLLTPARSLRETIADARGVTADGFLPSHPAFLPQDEERPVAPPDAAEVERAIWQAARAQDDIAAYENYLERYPEGFFVAEAGKAIEAIRNEPNRVARLAEQELDLSRKDQRQVQRQLTLLDYDPRGVDGIFGPATRAAITQFQTRNGFPGTGFLDARQIERMTLQADRRQTELEAEAKRQALEREKRDREDWAALSKAGDEASIQTYLEKHPNGTYAPIARDWLDRIEKQRQSEISEQDRRDWQTAKEADTIKAWRAYLKAHPKGEYAETAKTKIEQRQSANEANRKKAKDAEEALGLTSETRKLAEMRLQELGLKPGKVDGKFDKQSRDAIRAFQREEGLKVTGFMNEATVKAMIRGVGD